MKRIIIIICSLVLILSLLLISSCSSKPANTTSTTQAPNFIERVALAESRLTSIESTNAKQDSLIAQLPNANMLNALQTALNTNTSDIITIKGQLGNVKQTDTTQLQNDINALKSQQQTYQTQIQEQNAKIQALSDKIVKLETIPTPTPTTPGSTPISNKPVIIEIEDDIPITVGTLNFDIEEDKTISKSFTLNLTNNTDKDITNVKLAVVLSFTNYSNDDPIDFTKGNPDAYVTATGLGLSWELDDETSLIDGVVVFVSKDLTYKTLTIPSKATFNDDFKFTVHNVANSNYNIPKSYCDVYIKIVKITY